MISSILKAYGITSYNAEPIQGGLINRTWKVQGGDQQFILQQINDQIFKNPFELAENIRMIDQYLKEHSPGYLLVAPLQHQLNGDVFYLKDHGYFRLFPFIVGSHTAHVVSTAEQAFEAAFQFGKFARSLADFDALKLHITIPDFHNLTLRFSQFEDALKNGNQSRVARSQPLIDTIQKHVDIVAAFHNIQKSQQVKKRVMHHDTKISNVLFDGRGKGICVIDLDTIMPGYFISDVGDMMRTYLSPANEEESNFDGIEVRSDFFRAIVQGYLGTMGDALTNEEKSLFVYSGKFLIYMQALRFLTDYFNDDVYYGARYHDHNFVRAGNQLNLLEKLQTESKAFDEIVTNELKTKRYFHT